MDQALRNRFDSRHEPVPECGCWIWTGSTNGGKSDGYGKLSVAGKYKSAHRLSYELHRGPIPAGRFVCHRCDTPRCVNPDHLFLGDNAENMRDCFRKGRLPLPVNTGDKIARLRAALRSGTGGLTSRQIAAKHGVSKGAVWFALKAVAA